MMNNKITRIIANTVGLAAVAALGITVYQLGTAPVKENAPKEQTESTGQEEDSMVDVGNSQVESENQPLIQEEGEENQDYTQDTENTVENSLEDSEADEDEEIKIVRTKRFGMKPMYPEDACVQMELTGHDFFVFRNAETDEVNVVYKRKGNTFGLIEPEC